jgi:hypothetical protein
MLTYNTQLRSWGMEALAQGTLRPTVSAEVRAATIAARILDSREDYDVVCLNEVFDDDARDVLRNVLGGKYPNAVYKADEDNVALQIGLAVGLGGAAAVALAVPVLGWLGAVGLAYAGLEELLAAKFEDSGLMLFSRLPFATVAVSAPMANVLAPAGWTDVRFPIVNFVPYEDGASDDALAAKGVLYAQFVRDDGSPLHVFASHTQSDGTNAVGANDGVRDGQFGQIWGLVEQMVGQPPFTEEVVLCGDFNIDGAFHKHLTDSDPVSAEWKKRFGTHGSAFTDYLRDVWHYEQCPGLDDPKGKPVLPPNFDRGITTYNKNNQRLDYFLRPTAHLDLGIKPWSRLATQHIAIAYDVAQETNPQRPLTSYTSDHLPLKIDLNVERPRATVVTAERLDLKFLGFDFTVGGRIRDGQMDWFRIDEKGGYGFRLTRASDRVDFEVYTADDLSTPVAPFTVIGDPPVSENPYGTRFALPEAPFFVRVFLKDRRSEADYELAVHRYQGTSELDAIPIVAGVALEEEFKVNGPHSLDVAATPYSEHDSFWFVTQFDAAGDGVPVKASVQVHHMDQNLFGVLVLRRGPGGQKQELTEEPAGADWVLARFEYPDPAGGLILVRRSDPSYQAKSFRITFATGLSYLYGRPPNARALATLFCEDETNGFLGNESGSDDIEFNVSADGRLVVHADHDDFLKFDDDSQRNIDRWLDIVRYRQAVTFELVELDDLSPDDRTSVRIESYHDVVTSAKAAGNINPDTAPGKAHVRLRVAFDDDDGIYYLYVTASNRAPPQVP